MNRLIILPIITPILQSSFLCAQDIKVPVESFNTAITAILTYDLIDFKFEMIRFFIS